MDMSSIVTPVMFVTITGAGLGLLLAIIAKIMQVPVDEQQEKIREELPSINCGACGYVGCDEYAENLATKAETNVSLCTPGGPKVAEKLAGILGGEAAFLSKSAVVHCVGSCDKTETKYNYTGFNTCKDNATFFNGQGSCHYSCLGMGDCVKVCKYDAIYIDNGIAVVDQDRCTGCGMCANTCPKSIISVNPTTSDVAVACRSKDKGPVVRKTCSAGCIGCGLCFKECAFDAIRVENFLAEIDPLKCTNCLKCIPVCPTKVIRMFEGHVEGFIV